MVGGKWKWLRNSELYPNVPGCYVSKFKSSGFGMICFMIYLLLDSKNYMMLGPSAKG